MTLLKLLFCVSLFSCGLSDYENLSTKYYFEEGAQYTARCGRRTEWEVYWEIEPYGLKSSILEVNSFFPELHFTLRRDDQITISCFSKNNQTNTGDSRSTTLVWNRQARSDTPPPRTSLAMDVGDDADKYKCYTKNDIETCAALLVQTEWSCNCIIDFQIYTRIKKKKVWYNIDECFGDCYCTNTTGSSFCECHQGYSKNATGWCEDINECQLNISDCKKGELCWNTDGSFKCCANDTILDKNGCCGCPDHHIYYQNQGCVYDQCLNTSCGIGAECSMLLGKPFCFCPHGTAGDPHEECALLAEPGASPYNNNLEPSIEISIYVEKTDKSLKHFTTGADKLILGKSFTISVSARDVNFTKPEKRIICHDLDKPTLIHLNKSLETAAAANSKSIAEVPQAVISMNGTWLCLITGSTVHTSIAITFPVAINDEPHIGEPEIAMLRPGSQDIQ